MITQKAPSSVPQETVSNSSHYSPFFLFLSNSILYKTELPCSLRPSMNHEIPPRILSYPIPSHPIPSHPIHHQHHRITHTRHLIFSPINDFSYKFPSPPLPSPPRHPIYITQTNNLYPILPVSFMFISSLYKIPYFILFHLIPFHSISFHLILSYSIPSHFISSHPFIHHQYY